MVWTWGPKAHSTIGEDGNVKEAAKMCKGEREHFLLSSLPALLPFLSPGPSVHSLFFLPLPSCDSLPPFSLHFIFLAIPIAVCRKCLFDSQLISFFLNAATLDRHEVILLIVTLVCVWTFSYHLNLKSTDTLFSDSFAISCFYSKLVIFRFNLSLDID